MPSRLRLRGRLSALLSRWRARDPSPPADPVTPSPAAAPAAADLPPYVAPVAEAPIVAPAGGVPITHLTVHHTVTSRAATVADIRRIHVNGNGWDDVGYHYLLRQPNAADTPEVLVGRAENGDPWIVGTEVGAHTFGGRNADSIAIALIGNFHDSPLPESMRSALTYWLVQQCQRLGLDETAITGHKENPGNATVCPGAFVDMDRLRADVRALL